MDLTVSGKNILDEGFSGANVRDKENNNKFSKSGADFLLENIKKATRPVENTGMRNKDAISSSISTIAQNLGENTEAVQKIVDENEESQEEFVKLVKMMAAAQEKTGEASVAAIDALLKQIAKIEVKSGDNSAELTKLLGLDKTKETLMNQSNPLGLAGTAFKKFTNVDVRENETFGDSLKQAFSKEKLFGLQPKNDFDTIKEQVSLEEKSKTQSQGFQETVNAAITTKSLKSEANDQVVNAEGGKVFTAGIDRESLDNKKVELLEDILAELKKMSSGDADGRGLGLPPDMDLLRNGKPPTNTKPSRFSRFKRALGFADDVPTTGATATSTKSTTPRSLKSLLFGQADDVAKAGVVRPTLKPGIDDLLDRNGKPLRGAARQSRIDKLARAGTNVADDVAKAGVNVADDVVRGASTTSKVLGGTAKVLGKVAAPLAVAGSVYDGYQGYNAADQLVESGAINEETGQMFTEQDETAGKVEAVTKATGGLAGSLAMGSTGAALGASIGSIVPGVGTVIGGVVGGAIGGIAGYFAGSAAGEAIGDAATTTSGEAALDAAIESGLYNKDWIGDSEIDPEILKETTDTAQLQAILHDDDLDEKDTNRVLERLSQLEEGNSPAVTPSVSTNRNENSNAVDPKLKELNEKAASAEIAYNENPTEENYKAMADATLKSDEYILENNIPNANALVNMSPSDPSRMLMTGSDSASGLERIETSVTPTADAVGNMTEASASEVSQQAPTVINNITNNNTQASNSAPPVLINPTTSRNNVNSFIDFQARQYTRA